MFKLSRWWVICHWLAVIICLPLHAEPLRVLAIGDSLTEEYAFELPFSAPDSDPLDANTNNWPEILSAHRSAWFTLGSYNSAPFYYLDLRDGGYKYNYGVPSFRTWDWVAVCQSTILDTFSGDLITRLRYPTRLSLNDNLDEVDVVIIFLGGNDLKSNYTGIFFDPEPPALLANAVSNIAYIHDYVRNRAPTLPILIATIPDIGATAEVAGKYTDPVKRERARARIASMNASLIAMATARGATVARIDSLTDRIFDQVPLHLNGTEFIYAPDPENPPRSIFCKDGFHPATMAQALIADILVDALNLATAGSIPRLANREILGPVLGLNPDQPYLDWAAGAGGFLDNPDGDGLPNLAEFALATSPTATNPAFTFENGGVPYFSPSADAQNFVTLTVEESAALDTWQPVPESRIEITPDGYWRILSSGAARTFYRLAVTPKP